MDEQPGIQSEGEVVSDAIAKKMRWEMWKWDQKVGFEGRICGVDSCLLHSTEWPVTEWADERKRLTT